MNPNDLTLDDLFGTPGACTACGGKSGLRLASCSACDRTVCTGCSFEYSANGEGGNPRAICRECAAAAGLATGHGLTDAWMSHYAICAHRGDFSLACDGCGGTKAFADAVGVWKNCAECGAVVCLACFDPLGANPRCPDCAALAAETAGMETADPEALDFSGDAAKADDLDSPLDLSPLERAIDGFGEPFAPTVRPAPPLPVPTPPVHPSRRHDPPCIVCRTVPPPISCGGYGGLAFPAVFPCTLCGRTICQGCKVNRKTGTWNVFCCPDCLKDPREVIVRANPFRARFAGTPTGPRGGIDLGGSARRTLRNLFGLLGE